MSLLDELDSLSKEANNKIADTEAAKLYTKIKSTISENAKCGIRIYRLPQNDYPELYRSQNHTKMTLDKIKKLFKAENITIRETDAGYDGIEYYIDIDKDIKDRNSNH